MKHKVQDHPLDFVPFYLPQQGLHNLKKYRYSCEDKSLVAKYIMQPFWQTTIEFVPMWMACVGFWMPSYTFSPNLVTLSGFFFIVLSFCVSIYYNPSMTEAMPRWVYLLNAVCTTF
jgi:ethanolaminephosphotransferase